MEKKTFEVSNIQTEEDFQALGFALNNFAQVTHIKSTQNIYTFKCENIEEISESLLELSPEIVIKEVVNGVKRVYDIPYKTEREYYFMFKNVTQEEDIDKLLENLSKKSMYQNIKYDASNKFLILTSKRRNIIQFIKKELFQINPSIEVYEHKKPFKSEDLFSQKYMNKYPYIGLSIVALALMIITSRDGGTFNLVYTVLALGILFVPILKKVISHFKEKRYFNEELLVLIGLIMGGVSGAYIETYIAGLLYQLAWPLINKLLENAIAKIDEAVRMPEKGILIKDGEEEEISLYDFDVNDYMLVKPGQTIHISGKVIQGKSLLNTYSNSGVYDLEDVKVNDLVSSGDINAGKDNLIIQLDTTYESTNFVNLMNVASKAPFQESVLEKQTKKMTRYFPILITIVAVILGIVLPIVDFERFEGLIHIAALLLLGSGVYITGEAKSLVMLSGFSKAFKNGIIVESSLGLDSINPTQTIIYDRFDGVEVTKDELELFDKLSHIGKILVIFNDGPVALENDQYTIYNDLTVEEKMKKMDEAIGPVTYIGDSSKDIDLLQKSYVGISRGGIANSRVVENSDIVIIDGDTNKLYKVFSIARSMRTRAIANSLFSIFIKLIIIIAAVSTAYVPLWLVVIFEVIMSVLVIVNSTYVLE